MGVGENTLIARLSFSRVWVCDGRVDFLSKMNGFIHFSVFKNFYRLVRRNRTQVARHLKHAKNMFKASIKPVQGSF